MATIQVASDLHFEFLSEESQRVVFGPDHVKGDILVLAGDLTNDPNDFKCFVGKANHIIIVMGNHEYYGHKLDRIQYWKTSFEDFGSVHVMDNEVLELPEYDLRIIASTLWASLAEGTQAEECRRCIADFTAIRGMTTDLYMQLHQKAVDYISHVLASPFDGKTVVVTHHAPSWRSNHPKFAASAVAGLFCSNLEYLMEEYSPELWIHGHTHDAWDYNVFNTRVVCNPSGYYKEGPKFKKDLIIDL